MKERNISLYELLCLYVAVSSFVSIIAISLNIFVPSYVLTVSAAVIMFAFVTLHIRIELPPFEKFNTLFAAIILLSVFLRLSPYPHHVGGQDQGLYVNMAKVFSRTGTIYQADDFRQILTPDQRALYDANGGAHVAGAVVADPEKSTYRLSFYPLHPLWMALFAQLFGFENGVYSLLFFSILSVCGTYYLAYEISNHHRSTATIAALLVCLNPGLVFISKFPVSEIVAFAFTVNAFYFLAKGYLALRQSENPLVSFIVSAGLFNCFFYTRMSGFIFLPVLAIIYMVMLVDLRSSVSRRHIHWVFVALSVLFILSNLFYWHFYPELYYSILKSLATPLGANWQYLLSGGAVLMVLLAISLDRVVKSESRREEMWAKVVCFGGYLPYLQIAAFVVAGVAFGTFVRKGVVVPEWGLRVEPGLKAVIYSGLYHYVLLLSPIGVGCLALSPFVRPVRENGLVNALSGFVAFMTIVCLANYRYLAYSYYWDRYYLSELIPYSLILIAVVIGMSEGRRMWMRLAGYASCAIVLSYFAIFAASQLGKIEGSYPQMFNDLNKIVGDNDVLLFDMRSIQRPDHLRTPLIYYYDRKVFPIMGVAETGRGEVARLGKEFDHVYLLTGEVQPRDDDVELVKTLVYREGFFASVGHVWDRGGASRESVLLKCLLPLRNYEYSDKLYLYQMRGFMSRNLSIGDNITFGKNGNASRFLGGGWSDAEESHTWSNARSAELSFTMTPYSGDVVMKAVVEPLIWGNIKSQMVKVRINGRVACAWSVERYGTYVCDVKGGLLQGSGENRIVFEIPDATIPVGLDHRMLGLNFYSLRFDGKE